MISENQGTVTAKPSSINASIDSLSSSKGSDSHLAAPKLPAVGAYNTNTNIKPNSYYANLSGKDSSWMNSPEFKTPKKIDYSDYKGIDCGFEHAIGYNLPETMQPFMTGITAASRFLLNNKYIDPYLYNVNGALKNSKDPQFTIPIVKIHEILNQKEAMQKQLKENARKASAAYLKNFNYAVKNLKGVEFPQLLGNIGAICHPVGPQFDCVRLLKTIQDYLSTTTTALFSTQFWSRLYGHEELNSYLEQTTLGQAVIKDIQTMTDLFFKQLDDMLAQREYVPICREKQSEILGVIQAFCVSREGINPHSFCQINLENKTPEESIAVLLSNEGIINLLSESEYGQKLLRQLERFPTFYRLIKLNKSISEIDAKITNKEQQYHSMNHQSAVRRLFNILGIVRQGSEIKNLKRSKDFKNSTDREIIVSQQTEFDVMQKIQKEGVDSVLSWLIQQDENLQDRVCRFINLQECSEQIAPDALADWKNCASFVQSTIDLVICGGLRESLPLDNEAFYQAMAKFHTNTESLEQFFNRNHIEREQQGLLLACGALLPDLSRKERQRQIAQLTKFLHSRKKLPANSPDLPVEEYLHEIRNWLTPGANYLDERMLYNIVQWCLMSDKNEKFYQQLEQTLKTDFAIEKLANRYSKGICVDKNEIEFMINKIIKIYKPDLEPEQTKSKVKTTMLNTMLSQKKFIDASTRRAWFNLELASQLGLWKNKLDVDLSEIKLTNQHIREHHPDSEDNLVNRMMINKSDHLIVLEQILSDLLVTRNSLSTLEKYFTGVPNYAQQTETVNTLVTLMENTLFADPERLNQFRQQIEIMFNDDFITHFTKRKFEKHVTDEAIRQEAETCAEVFSSLHQNLLSFSPIDIHQFFDNVKPDGKVSAEQIKNALLEEIRTSLFEDYNNRNATTCTILSLLLHKMFSMDCIADLPTDQAAKKSQQLLAALAKDLSTQMSKLIDNETGKTLGPWTGPVKEIQNISNKTRFACDLVGSHQYSKTFSTTVTQFLNRHEPQRTSNTLTESEITELHRALRQHHLNGREDNDTFVENFIALIRKRRNWAELRQLAHAVNDYNFLLGLRNQSKEALSEENFQQLNQKLTERASKNSNAFFKQELEEATSSTAGDIPPADKDLLSDAQTFVEKVDKKNKLSDSLMFKINQYNEAIRNALQDHNNAEFSRHKKYLTEDVILAFAQMKSVNHIIGEMNARLSSRNKDLRDQNKEQMDEIRQKNYHLERERINKTREAEFELKALNDEINWTNKGLKKSREEKLALGTPFSRYLGVLNAKRPIYMVYKVQDEGYNTRVVAKNDGSITEHSTLDNLIKHGPYNETVYIVPVQRHEYSEAKQKETLKRLQSEHELKRARHFTEPAQESWIHNQSKKTVPIVNNYQLSKVSVRATRGNTVYFHGLYVHNPLPVPVKNIPPDLNLRATVDDLVAKYINAPDTVIPAHKVNLSDLVPLDYDSHATLPEAAAFPAISVPLVVPPASPPATAAAIPLAAPDAISLATQPPAAVISLAAPVGIPLTAQRSGPITLPVGTSVGRLQSTFRQYDAAEIANLFQATQSNLTGYDEFPATQLPGTAFSFSPDPVNPLPDLQSFRHLLNTSPNDPLANVPSASSLSARSPTVTKNLPARTAPGPSAPDDSFSESAWRAAQHLSTEEITAPNFRPKMLKPGSIQQYIAPAREFTIIDNLPYATNTGHANCLLNSLAMHFSQDYRPESPENLALVRDLRVKLIKEWQGKEGGFGADGFMSTGSGSCKAAVNYFNEKLKNTGQPQMRVIFHDYLRVGQGKYLEMVEATGPTEGREVHVLQHQSHFTALVRRSTH